MDLSPELKAKIDGMSQEDLARRWRFDDLGSTFWQGESGQYAKDRFFQKLGGFTPPISKRIGW